MANYQIGRIGLSACLLAPLLAYMVPCRSVSPKAMYGHAWGVASMDAYYYYVAKQLDGKIDGIDYYCEPFEFTVCCIFSNVMPDVLHRIPRNQAVVLSQSAQFHDLEYGP